MDVERAAVVGTVALVAVTAVLSGPLVDGIDFTRASEIPEAGAGTGTAEVSVESVPDVVVLERGDFGAGTYHMTAPDAVVRVGEVTGNPHLEYVIEIPAIDYVEGRIIGLHDAEGERLHLAVRPVEIGPRIVTGASYNGTISIRLQSDRTRVLYEAPIRIEVKE
jgi:hypothetical protein